MSPARVAVMLAVSDAAAAIDFYAAAFGAEERWRIEGGGNVVAGMSIDGSEFFLATASGYTRSPDTVGGTTVRIELFVDDPEAAFERAIAAGATEPTPITEHTHQTVDGGSFRMLQGSVRDPFGHAWLIGRFLD